MLAIRQRFLFMIPNILFWQTPPLGEGQRQLLRRKNIAIVGLSRLREAVLPPAGEAPPVRTLGVMREKGCTAIAV